MPASILRVMHSPLLAAALLGAVVLPTRPAPARPDQPRVAVAPSPIRAAVLDEHNADRLVPLRRLTDHGGPVTDVAFSHDGELLATSSADGRVRLWTEATGDLLRVLEGHAAEVASVDFSPDRELLVSGGYDRTARLWSVGEGEVLEMITSRHMGYVLAVEFAPGGSSFLMADHLCDVQLRRAPTAILDQTLRQPTCVRTEGTVESWGMAFAPDGDHAITGEGRWGSGGSIHRWNLGDAFQPPDLLEGSNVRVRDIAFSPSGDTIAVALLGSSAFWLMDAQDGGLIHIFDDHVYRVNSVAFSPRGDLLASASRDPSLKLWPGDGGEPLATYTEHSDALNSVEFSPRGDRILTGSDDGSAILWGFE